MELQVLRPYVFLGITKTKTRLKGPPDQDGFNGQVSSFVGPHEQVILAKSESHIEPLLSLVVNLDNRMTFEDAYFGCEVNLDNADIAEPRSINLAIVPINYRTEVFLTAWRRAFWKVYRMLGGKWVFLYPNPKGAQRAAIMKILREACIRDIVGLSAPEDYPLLKPKSTRDRRLNPLRAMNREARYQLVHAQSYARNEMRRIDPEPESPSSRTPRRFIDHRSQFILSLLDREIKTMQKAQKELVSGKISIQGTVALLDEFESVKNIVELTHERCWKPEKLPRQLLNSEEIFKVEDAFVFEAYTSARMLGPCPIVIPSVGYYFNTKEFSGNTRLIELPVTVGLRLGLLPILFHTVAHFLVKDKGRKLELYRKGVSRELGWSSDVQKRSDDKRDESRFHPKFEELLADLVAAEIGGPAYFYALGRGFAFDPGLHESVYLRIQDRLDIVRSHLQAKGFDIVSLGSHHVAKENEVIGSIQQKLAEAVGEINMMSNYSVETHKSTTEGVKRELMKGRILAAEPSIVVNALWTAVLERKGYLNEQAAFLSILEWAECTLRARSRIRRKQQHDDSYQ